MAHQLHIICAQGDLDTLEECLLSEDYLASKISSAIASACISGHLNVIEYLMKFSKSGLRNSSLIKVNHLHLAHACLNGHMNILHYLLTSEHTKNQLNIHHNHDHILTTAVSKSNFEMVRYLLASPLLQEHCDINAKEDHAFKVACGSGNLSIVQYLLESTDLKTHVQLKSINDGFINACCFGHFNIVVYLATYFSDHINVRSKSDECFQAACYQGHFKIVQFLLTSPLLKHNTPSCAINDYLLQSVCVGGSVAVLDYLLNSDELNFNVSFNINYHTRYLKMVAKAGCYHMMEYLLLHCQFQVTPEFKYWVEKIYLEQKNRARVPKDAIIKLLHHLDVKNKINCISSSAIKPSEIRKI